MIEAQRVDLLINHAGKLLALSRQQSREDSALEKALVHGALLQIHLALNCYCQEVSGTCSSIEEALFSSGNKDFRLLELQELYRTKSWLEILYQNLQYAGFSKVSSVKKELLIASDTANDYVLADAKHVQKLLEEFTCTVQRQRLLAREE